MGTFHSLKRDGELWLVIQCNKTLLSIQLGGVEGYQLKKNKYPSSLKIFTYKISLSTRQISRLFKTLPGTLCLPYMMPRMTQQPEDSSHWSTVSFIQFSCSAFSTGISFSHSKNRIFLWVIFDEKCVIYFMFYVWCVMSSLLVCLVCDMSGQVLVTHLGFLALIKLVVCQ